MTKAEQRALDLVAQGKVWRVYNAKGNVLVGGHASTLLRLERMGAIREDLGGPVGIISRSKMTLAPAQESSK